MKKTSNYNTARKQIINDKNNPQARKRRAEIRDKDERNIQRYGECPAKFKDFLSERMNENDFDELMKVSEKYSILAGFKMRVESIVEVAERNTHKLKPELMLKWVIDDLKDAIANF